MRVLQVTNTLHRGGAEAHLLLLAKGLQSRGVMCDVAFLRAAVTGGSPDLRQTFEDAGIRTHYLGCEHSYDVRAAVRLNRLLATQNWDVLHSHLPRCDAAAAACRLFSSSRTWISTLHHPYDSDDNAYSAGRWIGTLAPMWRLADGVIAVSEPVRQWAIERLGLGPDAVRTIVHGIDIEAQRQSAAPRSASKSRTHYCIGSIGRYEERKGHETLIRAMATVLQEFPDAELKIAGHDPWGHGEALQRMIGELRLNQHVHLVGFVDNAAFLSDVDVFAFASRSEGFGIVLLEAMVAGKPAVVSDISPLNSIICAGKSGLVADRDDPSSFAHAILSLLRDEGYRRRIAEEGKRRVAAEFSQEAMVDNTLQYYRDVMGMKGATAHGNGVDRVSQG